MAIFLIPKAAKFYPDWRTNAPFHLRDKKNFYTCQCGGDRFVFGSTPEFAYCLKCKGEINLSNPEIASTKKIKQLELIP